MSHRPRAHPRRRLHRRCRWTLQSLAALGLAGLVAASSGALAAPTPAPTPIPQTNAGTEALRRAGLRPVQPRTPAAELSLPDLAGETVSLSSYRDRWVLLTFFATWCGPCKSEMPTLQRLYTTAPHDRLAVVAVATDPDPNVVGQYVRAGGLTFPVLLDTRGTAAATYRAHSIPISYLLDPHGGIAGVARGARDWSGLASLIEQLDPSPASAGVGTRGGAPRGYQPTDAPIELPSTLVPPTATAELNVDEVIPDEPFEVRVRVRWAGTFDDYLLLPPHVALPEGITEINTSATTTSTAGDAAIDYRVSLTAAEVGEFRLDPVEVRYTPHGEKEPVVQRVSGPTIRVVAPTLLGLPTALTVALALTAALALLALGWLWRRRRTEPAQTVQPTPDATALSGLLGQARRARLEGDATAFLAGAAALYDRLEAERPAQLDEWLERARYAGQTPPSEQLDDLERGLERLIAARRPDLHRQALAGIALASSDDAPRSLAGAGSAAETPERNSP